MGMQGSAAEIARQAPPRPTCPQRQTAAQALEGAARQRGGRHARRPAKGDQRLILKLPLAVRRERNFSRAGLRMNQAASAAAMFSAEAM